MMDAKTQRPPFSPADILLPTGSPEKWAVIACDQYTSEPEYWQRVKETAGESPSTLNIVFPEAFLSEGDKRISAINKTMNEYLENGVFEELINSMIYVERTQRDGRVRKGIVGAVDLEDYDFHKGSKSKIRATEGTVLERIPPRVKIRTDAPLELPHVMLLINDAKKTVIPEKCGELLYDFELMEDSGHLRGYLMDDTDADRVIHALDALEQNAPDGLAYAVGDGNHSLATAKTCWDSIKESLTEEERTVHPARYCLVEIENIHDDALDFEPIHRVVFGVEPEKIIADIGKYYPGTSMSNNGGQHIKCVYGGGECDLYIKDAPCALAVGTLQKYLDERGLKTDYIHGSEAVEKLAKESGNIGFILPKPDKDGLFETVIKDGALPRKTFSMGEAWDKKFYMEAKKIK